MFSMVAEHWSNNAMFANYRSSLLSINVNINISANITMNINTSMKCWRNIFILFYLEQYIWL